MQAKITVIHSQLPSQQRRQNVVMLGQRRELVLAVGAQRRGTQHRPGKGEIREGSLKEAVPESHKNE